jgi:hypothetical protein
MTTAFNPGYNPYAIAPPQPIREPDDNDSEYELILRQQPQHAQVAIGKGKDRRPVDPPPILQLKYSRKLDPLQHYLQSK